MIFITVPSMHICSNKKMVDPGVIADSSSSTSSLLLLIYYYYYRTSELTSCTPQENIMLCYATNYIFLFADFDNSQAHILFAIKIYIPCNHRYNHMVQEDVISFSICYNNEHDVRCDGHTVGRACWTHHQCMGSGSKRRPC